MEAQMSNTCAVVERGSAINTPMNCPHNCGTYQAETIGDGKGGVIGHHYRCACSGCGIILETR